MGEKFIEWSDNRYPLSLKTILTMVSLYWFTDSYGRSMWAYRSLIRTVGGPLTPMPFSFTKPLGFSAFQVELATVPQPWAEHLFPNLVFYGNHDRVSGHRKLSCSVFAVVMLEVALLSDADFPCCNRAAISRLSRTLRCSWRISKIFWGL